MLRQAPPQSHELQEEAMWSQQQPQTQEEAEVNCCEIENYQSEWLTTPLLFCVKQNCLLIQ